MILLRTLIWGSRFDEARDALIASALECRLIRRLNEAARQMFENQIDLALELPKTTREDYRGAGLVLAGVLPAYVRLVHEPGGFLPSDRRAGERLADRMVGALEFARDAAYADHALLAPEIIGAANYLFQSGIAALDAAARDRIVEARNAAAEAYARVAAP